MDEYLKKGRKFVIGCEAKRWFEYMTFAFTGRKVEIPENVASSMFMQGAAMCAFGEYILDPSDERKLILNNTIMAIGEDFRF